MTFHIDGRRDVGIVDDGLIPAGLFDQAIEDAVDIASLIRDAGMDVVVETPDGDPIVIHEFCFGKVGLVFAFLQPVLMIAVIPEQCFVGDDQIGTKLMRLSYDIR